MKFENFKRSRRAVIMPVLKSVRKFLNILKQYAFPNYRSQLNVYDLIGDENRIALICFILSLCALILILILMISKRIKDRHSN